MSAIEEAGFEAVLVDPAAPGTVLDHVNDVAVAIHLLGRVPAEEAAAGGLHSERLASLLRRLVDTPVRAFVYEPGNGRDVVEEAGSTWRIPYSLVPSSDGMDWPQWAEKAVESTLEPLV